MIKPAAGPGVEMVDVAVPTPGRGEILVKVEATSICGSDLAMYEWRDWVAEKMKPGTIAGHEFCGTVTELGPGVTEVKVGDFVASETHVVDGTCRQCLANQKHVCENVKLTGFDRDGCFAEYAVIPSANAWVTDRSMPVEVASIQEPFGNGVHAALQGDLHGRSVLVTGCGPIGLFCVGIARAEGATAVYATDINDYRLGLARQMGADLVVNSTRDDPVAAVMSANGGEVDVALEMSGAAPAITQALKALRPGGWISLLGLPAAPVSLDLNDLVIQKGVTLYGIFGRRIWDTWRETTRLLGNRLVDVAPLITHRLPLEDVEEAMRLLEHGECGKIVLFPGGVPERP